MKKWFAAGVFFCLLWNAKAQVYDDFSDGNLTHDPAWLGQDDLFQVENGELRLFDPDPVSNNFAYLYLPAATSADSTTTWEWYVRLDFAPSSSNYARVYLQASGPDLQGAQWGYYLQFGGISGSNDALELFRQDSTSSELLISGSPGAMGAQPATARVSVIRTNEGLWSLYADYTGNSDLQLEGSAIDLTYSHGAYVGLACIYTSTRSDDFYFDDVYVDPLYEDQTPPQLLYVQATDSTSVKVVFDEALDEASAIDTGHYFIVQEGIGAPDMVHWDPEYPAEVEVHFPQTFESGGTYTLEVDEIADESGNVCSLQSFSFSWIAVHSPLPRDVLISEIMADPIPSVALPEVEYLEIYNRTEKTFQLKGWQLSDGGTTAYFPEVLLEPEQFLLLCRSGDEILFESHGPALGLEDFPGLNNTGEHILLSDAYGQQIDQVAYLHDWYRESSKEDGGWSLERINPLSPCEGAENWMASESLLGGTPGQKNARWIFEPDTLSPEPGHIFPNSPSTGILSFSEAMDPDALLNPDNYLISGGIAVVGAELVPEDPKQVVLQWSPALVTGVLYELSFSSSMSDCMGNGISDTARIHFGLPEFLDPGDIVLNELLFQPEIGAPEFIECFNRSEKILNLGDLILGRIDAAEESIEPVWEDRLILPGEYFVFCARPSDLLESYPMAKWRNMIKNDLPAMPDQGGNVTLYTEGEEGDVRIVDAVDYSPDWHHSFLHATRGVSLERIDPEGESQSASNWHSAAARDGYATPTRENSQFYQIAEEAEAFFMPYSTFSPDGDGEADFLLLAYLLEQNGWAVSIRIFDAGGRFVNELAQNELLATSGTFRWEGDDYNGNKARMGIYIVWIQLIHPEGKVVEEKLTCVLAGRI